LRSLIKCSRCSATGPFAPAVQPVISIVTFLHPPPTEFTCALVDHQRFITLDANKPNMNDAIVPSVMAVHRLGRGTQLIVPARVFSPLVGHLKYAILVVIVNSTISIKSNFRECKNDALLGHIHPIPISHAVSTQN
jgi:hypothetical protein